MHTNPGTPSPEGNPIVKTIYPPGTAQLPASTFDLHGTPPGNRRLIPVAPWGRIRIRAHIVGGGSQIGLTFGNSKGEELGPRVRATGTLTFTGQPLDTQTVVLDGDSFVFQTVLTDVDHNVLIGATVEESIDNLVAAINADPAGAGTQYAASGTANGDFVAAKGSPTTMVATAKSGGTSGNTLSTTETLTNASWGGASASGGVAGDITADGTVLPAGAPVTIEIPGVEDASPEHVGEAWLIVDVAGGNIAKDVVFFEASGASY